MGKHKKAKAGGSGAPRAAKPNKSKRAAALSHDTKEKREQKRHLLQINNTRNGLKRLKEQLEDFDPVEHARTLAVPPKQPKQKSQRSTAKDWKLRGAARPAHEVYDFDVRYVDPWEEERKALDKKNKRCFNLIEKYKSRNSNVNMNDAEVTLIHQYLCLLFQHAQLLLDNEKYNQARLSFKECVEVEGDEVVTTARYWLMRMYLNINKPSSARRLAEDLGDSCSVWVRFSELLVEYISFYELQEEGTSEADVLQALVKAVKCNVWAAYYISYHEKFEQVFEYVEDVEDVIIDGDSNDHDRIFECIEYCNSEQMGHWVETEGAVTWLRGQIERVLNGTSGADAEVNTMLAKADLEWTERLTAIEYQYEINKKNNEENNENGRNEETDEENDELDFLMYSQMFRTSMEIVQDQSA